MMITNISKSKGGNEMFNFVVENIVSYSVERMGEIFE